MVFLFGQHREGSHGGCRCDSRAEGTPRAAAPAPPAPAPATPTTPGNTSAQTPPARSDLPRVLLRYAIGVAAVVAALAGTMALWDPVFSRNALALFYAAVIVAAWFGGLGPGLLATALAAWAISYFINPSFLSLRHGWHNLAQAGTFALISLLISSLDAMRIRALTQLKSAKAAADAAREAAEAANRAKDRFLAVLSHELRTPLTPALAAAAAMEKDRSLAAAVRDDVAMIRRNIELEARLIDDLLDITRVQRGKLQLHPQPVDVHTLVGHVLEICRADAAAKRLAVDVDLSAGATLVLGDPARLHQVLWNLVKNAIKFTPAGGRIEVRTRNDGPVTVPAGAGLTPPVAAAAADDDDAGGPPPPEALVLQHFVLSVRDSGIGIAPHVLPRIFAAFEQGERANSHRFGGLGLGLAISKALVIAHGGELTADSEGDGRGATFTLRLAAVPVCDVATAPASSSSSPAAAPEGSASSDAAHPEPAGPALRVLLVEDHHDTARVMCRLLVAQGYDVRTAASVEGGMEAAMSGGPFDLLVSDLGLPDGNGLDLMRELRAAARAQGHRFMGVALSGYGMEYDLRRSREAGFAAHLTKPISFDALDAIIRHLNPEFDAADEVAAEAEREAAAEREAEREADEVAEPVG